MKTGLDAYTPLLYGKDYLGYAIRAVYDLVDEFHILYTPKPTFGHGVHLKPPESEAELKAAAFAFGDPGDKIRWHTGDWSGEGQHRSAIEDLSRADTLLALDADEVWDPDYLQHCLDYVSRKPARQNLLTGMTHLWRSFGWACRDQMAPCRIVMRNLPDPHGINYLPSLDGSAFSVLHFGYAQRPSLTRYKWQVHGHQSELRDGWLDGKFLKWPPGEDVHPTCERTWTPEPLDRSLYPSLLRQHPFYEADPISDDV